MGVPELFRALLDVFGDFSVKRKNISFKKVEKDANADMYGSLAKTLAVGDPIAMVGLVEKLNGASDLETLLLAKLENDMQEEISQIARQNDNLQSLAICIDGIPPFAKIVQQRERRFAAAIEYEEETDRLNEIIKLVQERRPRIPGKKTKDASQIATDALMDLRGPYDDLSKSDRAHIDTLRAFVSYRPAGVSKVSEAVVVSRLRALRDVLRFQTSPNLTPGTPFMQQVDRMFQTLIESNRSTWGIPQITYSSFHVPKEGEHKIMDLIREEPGTEQQQELLLQSPDADVLLLALLSGRRNIYVQKEKEKNYTVLDIDKLRQQLQQRVQNREMLEDDFVFALSVLGNDFMPPLVEMSNYKNFMRTFLDYLKMSPLFLAGTSSVYWPNYFDMLETLRPRAALETRLEEAPFDFASQYVTDRLDYKAFRTAWYWRFVGVQPQEDSKKKRLLELLKTTEAELVERIAKQAVHRYLNTALFVYSYYKEGTAAVSSGWAYGEYYPPLLDDLITMGRQLTEEGAVVDWKNDGDNEMYQSTLYQLAMVLPQANNYLLPLKMQNLAKTDELGYLYPRRYQRDQDYRMKSFQEVSVLPVPDLKQVIQYIDTEVVPQLPKKTVAEHKAGIAQTVTTAVRKKPAKKAETTKSRFGRSVRPDGRGEKPKRGRRGRGRGRR